MASILGGIFHAFETAGRRREWLHEVLHLLTDVIVGAGVCIRSVFGIKYLLESFHSLSFQTCSLQESNQWYSYRVISRCWSTRLVEGKKRILLAHLLE